MYDENAILEEFRRARGPVSASQLARTFRLKGTERRELRQLLRSMAQEGKLLRLRGTNYTLPDGKTPEVVGRLQVASRGFGFVKPDWSGIPGDPPFAGDLHIPMREMGDALDGDIVRAMVLRKSREGSSGRIVTVLERAHSRIVGWYQRTGKRGGEVHPRSTKLDRRIYVSLPDKALGISDFEWVETEITEFTRPPEPLRGKVVRRIGSDEDRGIDVLLVLRDMGIEEEFPASVEQEAEALDFNWRKDLKGRKDFRKLPTLTIDPKTAKDYDDGLSIEPLEGGGWRLYVHIADVAHFVRPGMALDTEAQERSTSTYPVDRVVPMLPERLSNNLCSLVPDEDRLAVTAIIEIGPEGKRLRSSFHSSVIYSDCRAAYEEIQGLFVGKKPGREALRKAAPIAKDLRELAGVLRKARFARGALDLDIPEVEVLFDEHGAVSDLVFAERFEAHQLVEECMLAANEAVASYLEEKNAPLLYRIHEVADEERLERLLPALKVFGIKLRSGEGGITPKALQKALDAAHRHPAGHIIRRLVLRSLKRAEYNPENAGHFGLASECYCHFTSPIRRYPDIVAHRQIKALEAGRALVYPEDDNDLDALGEHTSSRERRAQEAEWEATAIKSLEYMKRHEGDEFDGYICSVHDWGIFVELDPHPVQGLIPKVRMRSDRYDLDDTGVRLVGRNSGFVYKLGDRVKVRIDKVDPMAQQLDLTLLEPVPKTFGRRARKGWDRRRW